MLTARQSVSAARTTLTSTRLTGTTTNITKRAFASSSSMKAEGSTSADALVQYDSSGNARIYKLNRPKKLNSLNHEMITSLAKQMKIWKESELCKLIIGVGDQRAFCAGGDVAQLVTDAKGGTNSGIDFFKEEFELNWLMSKLGKPYVSVIDGVTMGGGCGIALPAPIRIATSKTIFAMPETGIGYAPDVGVNYYLAQLDGSIGAWLAVTGTQVFGRAVYELGLATHYVPQESLSDLIRQLTHHPEPTLANISKLVSSFHPSSSPSGTSTKANPDGATSITSQVRSFLDETFSSDNVSEIHKKLVSAENNQSLTEEVRTWAGEQRKIMDTKSPTGMAVALSGFRKAKKSKRLDQVLKNDMTMASAFCVGNKDLRQTEDFIIGVTHVLIDKVKNGVAKWSPSSLSDPSLSPSSIERFFTPSESLQSIIPTLNFDPPASSNEGDKKDSTFDEWRNWGLPTEIWVKGLITGEAKNSGAMALKEDELLERILDVKGETYGDGGRKEDIVRVVKELIKEKCTADKNGYLKWTEKRQSAKL